MADYTWVAIIERGSLLPDKEWMETPHGKKVTERDKNRWNDGKRSYKWSDSDERGFSKRSHDFTFKKIRNDEKNFG